MLLIKIALLGLIKTIQKRLTTLSILFPLIATIMQETNGILEELGDSYYTSYKVPIIS